MRLRTPRKGSKPKKKWRGKANVESKAVWWGVRALGLSSGRSERFEVRTRAGKKVFTDSLKEAGELLQKRGKLSINGLVPPEPGVYYSEEAGRWVLRDYWGFGVKIISEGELEDVLELFDTRTY